MKIAVVSLDQVWEDKEANLKICKEYIRTASQQKVDLIIFPEMTLSGFSTNIELIAEDKKENLTIENFSKLAKKYSIAMIFGVVIKDREKALNQAVFLDNKGKVIAKYNKIHPFSFAGEDRYFNAGEQLGICNFQDYKIGLSICYDLRFPELYSAMAKECDAIVNIANWPKKRVVHWNALLKARAIENQVFIVGVNRVGIDGNGLQYQESSEVYNANGESLKPENTYKNMKIYTVDRKFTEEFKQKFNTTNDRKPNFYKEII